MSRHSQRGNPAAQQFLPPTTFRITGEAFDAIRTQIGARPAETGGILGGPDGEELITEFHFDHGGSRSRSTYSPDHIGLTRLLKQDWNPRALSMRGFAHSHPSGFDRPSHGDEVYAQRILDANPHLQTLYMPIIQTRPDRGQFSLAPYAAVRSRHGIEIRRLKLEIVDTLSEPTTPFTLEPTFPDYTQKWVDAIQNDPAFSRVQEAYDLRRMALSRLIVVGVGGAAAWLDDMARAGLGSVVLIDPDRIEEPNLSTQQVYRRDIGRPKVDAMADRLRDINPHIHIITHTQRLEALDDQTICDLAQSPMGGDRGPAPEVVVLCGMTDAFEPQARINRLALKLGLPSLCAQLYHEGRGLEVTFTHPETTVACHRCALQSRYGHYQRGGNNDVTSHGTPIFATTRLNALKGMLTLALLHHRSGHSRWGDMLQRIGHRNLIQVRTDPELPLKRFTEVFANADYNLCDETLWLPQRPDRPDTTGLPECPDCGGTGNLLDCLGDPEDSNHMRPTQPRPATAAETDETGT